MIHIPFHYESFSKRIFDYSSNGIALITPKGEWMNANPMLCRMLGYSCGELMIRTFMDIIHPEERLDDLKQFLEGTTESIDTQRRLLHKNGHVVYVSLNLLRIADEIPAMPTCIMLQF